uniref:LysM domain-containing protein n=1 Tax=Hemiselmis andersenii TaxID=464988 RepID=A0A7S1MZ16_HEMAN
MSARAIEGFGGGFRARFTAATRGSGLGTSGAVVGVEIINHGSGYFKPPHIVISEGGRGCEGPLFEAVLGTRMYHPMDAYPGVGLEFEIIAADNPFDTIKRFAIDGDLPELMVSSALSPPVESNSPRGLVSRTFKWDPPRSVGGSRPLPVCFSVEDNSGEVLPSGTQLSGKTDSACFMFTVKRCAYAIKGGETLLHVAAYYGTNWIQIWAANVLLQDPEGSDISEGQLINVGHTYTMESGDEMSKLSRKFGMSTEAMYQLNYDIAQTPPELLGAGQQLCIIPNSCATNV